MIRGRLGIGLALLAASLRLFAQEATPPPRTEAGELRLALTNAIVQEIKNGKYVKFSLKWAYLPETPSFRARMATDFGLWEGSKGDLWDEFRLTNEQLQSRKKLNEWWKSLKDRQREILGRAFLKDKYYEYKTPADIAKHLKETRLVAEADNPSADDEDKTILGEAYKAWNEDVLKGLGVENGGTSKVPWFDYITARRDFFAMHFLLARAYGAGASVAFAPDPRGPNPVAVTSGLTWRIRVFPVSVDAQKPLYRFAVETQTPTISKTFSSLSKGDNAEVTVTVGLLSQQMELAKRKFRRMLPVTIGKDMKTVEKQAFPGAEEVEDVSSKLSPSVGATTISALTGSTPGGLLAPLFQNSSEAAPFVGALIGNGATATTYGINYVLTERPDMNLGFVYGLVSDKDSALFLGPSFQFGPFTAAVGSRIFNRSDESVSGALAGTLSIDLAKVFNSKPKPVTIRPVPVLAGSKVWQDVDAMYKSTLLLPIGVRRVGEAPVLSQPATLMQTAGPDGKAPGAPFVSLIPYSRSGEYALIIVPRGDFLIKAPTDALIAEVDPDALASGKVPDGTEFVPQLTYSSLPITMEKVTQASYFVVGRGYDAEIAISPVIPPIAGLVLVRTKGPDGDLPEAQRSVVPITGQNNGVTERWLATGTYALRAPSGYEVSKDNRTFAAEVSIVVADPAAPLPRTADVGVVSDPTQPLKRVAVFVRKKS